jgi:arginine deiminase
MFANTGLGFAPALAPTEARLRWGADSEYGRLTDVLLSAPHYLEMVPCNSVSRENIENGLGCCPVTAAEQHEALVRLLGEQGVACHFAPASPDLADLTFTRDAALITPWGLVELRPGAAHRSPEASHVARTAEALGVPLFGKVRHGTIEGGDICLLRPGTVLIGYSGERTDRIGAEALSVLFETKGWEVIFHRFDPHYLHLDTFFAMVGPGTAIACLDLLSPALLERLDALGIELIPATREEVRQLGANLLSLGDCRVVSPSGNCRINGELRQRGYDVLEAELDQFIRCGGGIHCLTLPLTRRRG